MLLHYSHAFAQNFRSAILFNLGGWHVFSLHLVERPVEFLLLVRRSLPLLHGTFQVVLGQ